MSTCDVAVIGGGPAGLLCALLLAQAKTKPLLVRKQVLPAMDGRTVALLESSVVLLRQIGVWDRLRPQAAPLRAMRLVDDANRFMRAPTVIFEAKEIGLESFGYNIANEALQAVLEEKLAAQDGITIYDSAVETVSFAADHVLLAGKDFEIRAKLIAAADGRASLLRSAAEIPCRKWSYPQTAVTAILHHGAPHHGISTEFHTNSGPLTFVPLQNNQSSLVAVVTPEEARQLMSMSEEPFCSEMERRCHSLLGAFKLAGKRSAWPLEGLLPQRFAAKRIALIGEAAHVLPPIGAQGLNLGFRDAALLAELAARAVENGKDPGNEVLLDAYHEGRQADIRLRSFAVDAFNRSLLTPFIPAHLLRGFGLYLAQASPILRKTLMRAGLAANLNRLSEVS